MRLSESSIVFVLAVAALVAGAAPSATVSQKLLSDADVEDAIKKGQNKKYSDLISSCVALSGFGEGMAAAVAGGIQDDGGYDVSISSAAGRIAVLAADAKRLYKPFSLETVTKAMRSMESVFVVATPQKPSSSSSHMSVASPLDSIVLKSKANPAIVLQPTDIQITPVEWGNLLGGKVTSTAGVATFDMKSLKDFPAGDIDVVLITQKAERRCKIGQKDRALVIR